MDFSKGYIIAEIGVNYYDIAKKENISLMEAAKLMIKKAKEAGAHATKFQSYKANKIASSKAGAFWDTKLIPEKSQVELYKKYDLFGEEEYKELSSYCDKIGIDFMSTPFDLDAVDFLKDMQKSFKVASCDLTNYPLLKKIAKIGKPLILSTGGSNFNEIKATVQEIRKVNKNIQIVLLHCILCYPTKNEDANLNRIKIIKENIENVEVGYSDHTFATTGMGILSCAYSLGAKVIEKHFTLDKTLKGNDHYHGMDPKDLKIFRENLEIINLALNKNEKDFLNCEIIARKNARRSLVLNKNMKKGEIIKEEDLICKRPGIGISPTKLNEILGKKVNKDLEEDHILIEKDLN